MSLVNTEIKLCQSCIERGLNPPNQATREWQSGIFWCDECFNAIINNLTNVAPASATNIAESQRKEGYTTGPLLDRIYEILGIPEELQFDKVDTVCRNYERIFNFAAPAIVNMNDYEALAKEIEEREMAWFYIKYTTEPLTQRINVLKEQRRKEKNLKSYDDSKEVYSKTKGSKTSATKTTQEEKLAKAMGKTLAEYREMVAMAQSTEKKKRERQFNILAGNCPECGGAIPCSAHPS